MKTQFDENNSSAITQTRKNSPKKIKKDGKVYTYVGKTKDDPSKLTKLTALTQCFLMILAGSLVIPCFSKPFRKKFKNTVSELRSGQEIIKHYVLNTHTVILESKIP